MYCMKCGREIETGQVFCPLCLEEMKKFPIKPDAIPFLPNRAMVPSEKKQSARRPTLTPDEQLHRMRRRSRFLAGLLAVAIVMLLGVSALTGVLASRLDMQRLIGRNYKTVASTETTASAAD